MQPAQQQVGLLKVISLSENKNEAGRRNVPQKGYGVQIHNPD